MAAGTYVLLVKSQENFVTLEVAAVNSTIVELTLKEYVTQYIQL